MKVSVIICAAGKGERAGFERNKLLYPFHGANALYYAVKRVKAFSFYLERNAGDVLSEIIVTSSAADVEEITAVCAPFGCKIIFGGSTRTESVYNALKYVTGDIVLVHDGARPYATVEQFARCLECAKQYGSAVTAMRATDTFVLAKDGLIEDIPDRNALYALQTPQGFISSDLKAAYEKAIKSEEIFTDDSSVYSRYISPARLCPCGSSSNRKLTFREDFIQSSEGAPLLEKFAFEKGRLGFGVDTHAFGKKANFVTLCGVKIPCDCSLIAHSDGDVVYHAVMDALLSAAALKDIGHYFPDNDKKYENADSGKLLERVVDLVAARGLKPVGLSVAIQAEKPRLAPYIDDMRRNLAELTGADTDRISIAAGTCEGLGFVGEKLGICAYCAAVLEAREDI